MLAIITEAIPTTWLQQYLTNNIIFMAFDGQRNDADIINCNFGVLTIII